MAGDIVHTDKFNDSTFLSSILPHWFVSSLNFGLFNKFRRDSFSEYDASLPRNWRPPLWRTDLWWRPTLWSQGFFLLARHILVTFYLIYPYSNPKFSLPPHSICVDNCKGPNEIWEPCPHCEQRRVCGEQLVRSIVFYIKVEGNISGMCHRLFLQFPMRLWFRLYKESERHLYIGKQLSNLFWKFEQTPEHVN